MPPTVLHVSRSVGGGVGRVVGELLGDQVSRGWSVAVACPEGPLAERALEVGARHLRWDAQRPVRTFLAEWKRLRPLVAEVAPDVVYLHSAKAGMVGRLAVRGRIPTVYAPHCWPFTHGARTDGGALRWERFATRWTTVLHCVSEAEARRGSECGIHVGRVVIIPNGVHLERFDGALQPDARERSRERLGLGPAPTALCVGRVCHQKAQDVLLDAWPAVRRAVPDAQLVVVGEGPMRAELEARGVDGVQFVGHRDDIVEWFAAADVVVQPSRLEGMALTVLEALASRRSVVVSEADGMVESVGAGPQTAGAVVAIEDPVALAARIVERLLDPELARREGEYGRQRVEQHFDQRRVDDAVADLILSLTRP